MSSESPNYYIILSGVVAALISSSFSLWMSSLKDKSQLEREEKQRIWQQKNDQQKWYREKIYDSYKKAIQLLTEILQLEYEIEKKYMIDEGTIIKFNKLLLELEFEFDIITFSYPSENYEEFDEKLAEYSENFKTDNLKTRLILIELMENDSRIISISK
jgi:cell division protein FtsI/penicillin-binding protein 2